MNDVSFQCSLSLSLSLSIVALIERRTGALIVMLARLIEVMNGIDNLLHRFGGALRIGTHRKVIEHVTRKVHWLRAGAAGIVCEEAQTCSNRWSVTHSLLLCRFHVALARRTCVVCAIASARYGEIALNTVSTGQAITGAWR